MRILLVLMQLCMLSARGIAQEPPKKTGSIDLEEVTVQPGLVAHYRSLGDFKTDFTRIEAKPAFYLGHSSPDPRIPPGRFEVVWTGLVDLMGSTPVSFDAFVCGELSIEVDGAVVLQGKGDKETSKIGPGKTLELPGGMYRLKVHYKSLDQSPARLQIWWQGESFTREPVPAWRLKHIPKESPARLARDQLIDQGRRLVGQYGCARCHQRSLPGVDAPPPGPALADLGTRISRDWLLRWLENPSAVRTNAKMPVLFSADRNGYVERWLIAEHLLGTANKPEPREPTGSHRMGRRHFINFGCATCHFLPDMDRKEQADFQRVPLTDLKDRLPADQLAAFLGNPQTRYPDGRMPRLPLAPDVTRDLAAYLLEYSTSVAENQEKFTPPTEEEIKAVFKRLKISERADAGATLVRQKGCAQCHSGIGSSVPNNSPLKVPLASTEEHGCLSGKSLPKFNVDPVTQKAIASYLLKAEDEWHASSFAKRQQLVEHLGCVRCHQRDSDRPSPLEAVGSTLGGAWVWNVPFQRAPRLTNPHQKFTQAHLRSSVAEGVKGLRISNYTYRMPEFGNHADAVVQALAEADGELPNQPDAPQRPPADPLLSSLNGPVLAGFRGYSCVSCHVWNGKAMSSPDPGAVGTDLTRLNGRIRREWFDRYLEAPTRVHPGTPMPSIFMKGRPAMLSSVLDGDVAKQKDALWTYFIVGGPEPKPPAPIPVVSPAKGEPALVAQIPVRLPNNTLIEGICVLNDAGDLFVYDLATYSLHSRFVGGQIQRTTQGRDRIFHAAGTQVGDDLRVETPLQLAANDKAESPVAKSLHGYDRLNDGVRIRWRAEFAKTTLEVEETFRFAQEGNERRLTRQFKFTGASKDQWINLSQRAKDEGAIKSRVLTGLETWSWNAGVLKSFLRPDDQKKMIVEYAYSLPAPHAPPAFDQAIIPDDFKIEGSLERPGYKAIMYPRPKTVANEDLIMPAAVAVHPKDGRVFVASMKTGSLFVLNDPTDDGKKARFDDYAHGLFQEAYSMLAESDRLYVLHRRNLTRITESKDGTSERFDCITRVDQAVADAYDYGYGLVRDKSGAFIFSQAPHADRRLKGAGNALRLEAGGKPTEIAYGFRNPLGWATNTDGEVFFTDNQGEWVATNKLCYLQEDHFHGYPNAEQKQYTQKTMAKTSVWVPYGWAKSINGMTCDKTSGKFGPFAGQFFLAELMFGGGIIRADVEKVNGVYQGVCFPFWGQGLLGPVSLAFDPKGRLFVGGINEPAWMAQPDRGALFRIDFTGQTPFEMQTIRALPNGFRIHFTQPVSGKTASDLASYRIESFRYEYTGAYGSPELERSTLKINSIKLAKDGRSVDVLTAPLTKDRVYMIEARGIQTEKGEALVHPIGAYTLNEIPGIKP